MDPAPPALLAADLAPGDSAAADFDWASLRVVRIRRPDHPLLEPVYCRLWREFGARGEMETRPVIAPRFSMRSLRWRAEETSSRFATTPRSPPRRTLPASSHP